MSSNTGRCSCPSRVLGARAGNRARSASDRPGIHSDGPRALPGYGSLRRSQQARYLRQNRLHHMGFLDSRQLRVEALMLVSKAVVVDPEQV